MAEKNRNRTIDVIKGIAIILVIYGHCIQFGSGVDYLETGSFYNNSLFKFIYSFHMPLFMLISGHLFYYTMLKHSYKDVLHSRFKSLIVPIIIWQTLSLFAGINNNIQNFDILTIFNSYLFTLWFISSVFINSVIVLICKKYAKDSLLVYFTFFILSLIIPNYFGYNVFVFMFPFFLCGYFFNKLEWSKKTISTIDRWPIYISLFILFSFLLYYFDKKDYIYTSGTFIIRNKQIYFHQIMTDCYRWFIGLIGSLCVIITTVKLCSMKILHKSVIMRGLSMIGTKTMGLYIVSTYIFQQFHLIHIRNNNFVYHIIELIAVLCISSFITFIIEKNKKLRTYLLGGR